MSDLTDSITDRAGVVSPAEAREILSRFCASHFRDTREHARISIPADPTRDDDIRMSVFIRQAEHLMAIQADFESLQADAAEVVRAIEEGDSGRLKDAIEALRVGGRPDWWQLPEPKANALVLKEAKRRVGDTL